MLRPRLLPPMRPLHALTLALISLVAGCTDGPAAAADATEQTPSSPAAADPAPRPAAGSDASQDFVVAPGLPGSITFRFAGGSLRPEVASIASAAVGFQLWGVGDCQQGDRSLMVTGSVVGTHRFGCGSLPPGDYTLHFGVEAGLAQGTIKVPGAALLE
jgi:hypothetical protein